MNTIVCDSGESKYPFIFEGTAIGLGLEEYNKELIVKKIDGKEEGYRS